MKSLNEVKVWVDGYLRDIFKEYQKRAKVIDQDYGGLLREMNTLVCRGGKRIRPYLTYLSYVGCGGVDEEAILPIAASQDLYHNLLLVHDDIIDRDLLRYGGLNIAGKYRQRFAHLNDVDKDHFADSMALLAGDVLYSIGHQTVLASNFSAEQRLAALQIIDACIFDVAGGEVADMLLPLNLTSPKTDTLMKMYAYKTANYSFEVPLALGMLMAGLDQAWLKKLPAFTQPLGIAYQLQDDILGMYGDAGVTGKPVLSDMREGKRTVLIETAFKQADPSDKEVLQLWYGNSDAGQRELEQVQEICKRCGALDSVMHSIRECTYEAERSLPNLPFNQEVTTVLSELVATCCERKK